VGGKTDLQFHISSAVYPRMLNWQIL